MTPTTIDQHISEADFQDLIVDYARLKGWRIAHFRPARTNEGWRTAVSYEGHGYPDLTLARQGHVIFLEVKSAEGRTRPEQQTWVDALPNAYIVKPAHWPQIETLLK